MAMSRRSSMSKRSDLSKDIKCRYSGRLFHDPEYCFECQKIAELEAKQSLNANKLRFRFVKERPREIANFVVYDILNRAIRVPLADIGDCTRVYPWEKQNYLYWPWDILVTFPKQNVRDFVYDYKSCIEVKNPGLRIIEELAPECGLMWKNAVVFFGRERVTTFNGVINVSTYSMQNLCVYTVKQMDDLIHKEMKFLEYKKRREAKAKSVKPKQWRKW